MNDKRYWEFFLKKKLEFYESQFEKSVVGVVISMFFQIAFDFKYSDIFFTFLGFFFGGTAINEYLISKKIEREIKKHV